MNRITQKLERFNEENLNQIIDNITQNLENISAVASSSIIPFKSYKLINRSGDEV